MIDWTRIAAWAFDFARCVEARPRLCRWAIYFALGQYGRREYRGIVEAILDEGLTVDDGYDLEGCSYHRDGT